MTEGPAVASDRRRQRLAALCLALAGCEPAVGMRTVVFDAAIAEDRAPPRWATCLERRVDLSSDPLHCGSCETSCLATQRCNDGFCVALPACVAPMLRCTAACVDVRTDPAHCGACGRACPAGTACTAGNCACALTGLTVCNGACVDLRTNAQHCGVCGRVCSGLCVAGSCRCDGGLTLCAAVCVDTTTSAQHCGRCNAACAQGACAGGVCQCSDARLTSCAGQCVDTRVRVDHCGACGRACSPGADCAGGACVARPWWPPYGARVGSRTPTLRWVGDDAGLELCADRACASVLQRFERTALRRVTVARVEPGVYWWRLVAPDGAARSVTSVLRVDARDAPATGVLPPFVDVNGDGLADVAVLAARPAVLSVFLGGRDGAATVGLRVPAGSFAEDGLVRAAGDPNADGFGDLGVATRATSVLVAEGAASPAALRTRMQGPQGPQLPAMDVNADGFGDWLVLPASGGAQVMYGARGGLVAGTTALAHPAGVIPASGAALLGDVDGDDLPDVAVGAPSATPARVYVYFGGSAGLSRAALLTPPPFTAGYGAVVRAAGDVNGDGFADVLAGLGARGAVVHHGGRVGLTRGAALVAEGVELAVYAAGDVDGDGFSDLLGLPGGRDELWLYRGAAEGVSARPEVLLDARWRGVESVGAPGDVDGDGFDDVTLAAPSADRVLVLYGGSAPFVRATTLTGTPGTEFGRALQ